MSPVLRPLLTGLAGRAPAPVFAAVGAGHSGAAAVERLRLDPRVRLVDSPRHATVLLVTGVLPASLLPALSLTHDALPRPRATVLVGSHDRALRDALPDAMTVGDDRLGAGALGDVVVAIHRSLVAGELASEAPILPNVDPVEWRGVGPYGHGGSAMTGGHPYGRPLADRSDDLRDGLKLDTVEITLGPFLPGFPAGLQLRAGVRGDILDGCEIVDNPFDAVEVDRRDPLAGLDRIADRELARARHHLHRVALQLRLAGLDGLGLRALRLASTADLPPPAAVHALRRAVARTGLERWSLGGVGVFDAREVADRGLGLLARASGVGEDARADDPAYTALGFTPCTGEAGDVSARLVCRLAEAAQSLDLAARAGDAEAGPDREGIYGHEASAADGQRARGEMIDGGLLVGMEWGDALATLVSLDLDLAVGSSPVPRPGERPGGDPDDTPDGDPDDAPVPV